MNCRIRVHLLRRLRRCMGRRRKRILHQAPVLKCRCSKCLRPVNLMQENLMQENLIQENLILLTGPSQSISPQGY
jgi:hypothetical protein